MYHNVQQRGVFSNGRCQAHPLLAEGLAQRGKGINHDQQSFQRSIEVVEEVENNFVKTTKSGEVLKPTWHL